MVKILIISSIIYSSFGFSVSAFADEPKKLDYKDYLSCYAVMYKSIRSNLINGYNGKASEERKFAIYGGPFRVGKAAIEVCDEAIGKKKLYVSDVANRAIGEFSVYLGMQHEELRTRCAVKTDCKDLLSSEQ
jgi:hypothetical protein